MAQRSAGEGSAQDAPSVMQWVVSHASAPSVERQDSSSACGSPCAAAAPYGSSDVSSSGGSSGGGSGGPVGSGSDEGGGSRCGEDTPRAGCEAGPPSCVPSPARGAAGGSELLPAGPPPPRASYCCRLVHGLPGGCRFVDLPCEHVWDALSEVVRVQVGRVAKKSL